MLVDGCLIDNVPLAQMHQLKSGPNLVVHFGDPAAEMFDVDYAELPGRFELIAAMLTPFRKKLLPAAPSAVNVLWRSLVAHQRYDTLPTAPLDHVMRPPFLPTSASPNSNAIPRFSMRPISGPERPSRRWRRKAMRPSPPSSPPGLRQQNGRPNSPSCRAGTLSLSCGATCALARARPAPRACKRPKWQNSRPCRPSKI